MKLIRSSKHILKYQTDLKSKFLDQLFQDYKTELQFYIDLIWDKKLPLEKFLSSKLLPNNKFLHSQWKQVIYKNASEIIRANTKRKKTSKPIINNIGINIDARLFDIEENSSAEFDIFCKIFLPYLTENQKHRYLKIKIPIRQHKHSLKYKNWKRLNTIKLTKSSIGNYYITFAYENEIEIKSEGDKIGIDIGYKKLLSTSNGKFIGTNFQSLCTKISRTKRGSKNQKQLLFERNKIINELCNQLDLNPVNHLVIENLKNLKFKTKQNKQISTNFMRKLQYWSYPKVIQKLQFMSEENGVLLEQVQPEYTSQECSECGFIHNNNRNGELFKCLNCGFEIDADYNASINIRNRGVYNPSASKINSADSVEFSRVA